MPPVSRRTFLRGAAGGAVVAAGGGVLLARSGDDQGSFCPHSNPIVNENRCSGRAAWSKAFQLEQWDGALTAWATQNSWDMSELVVNPVTLQLGRYGADGGTDEVRVYRLGYYGGTGGRLIHTQQVTMTDPGETPPWDEYGYRRCRGTKAVTLTGFVPPTSGMYLAKIVTSAGFATHAPFVIRDDRRARKVLVALPTNTWQAYNNWGGKSVYSSLSVGPEDGEGETIAGTSPINGGARAVKVSFDRPLQNVFSLFDWVLHTEFPLIYWLEREGYDLAYTEDTAIHRDGKQLLPDNTKVLALAGHSEYWTSEMREAVAAARSAGTHIAAFGANTGFWRARYEDKERTLVVYKTIEGTGPQEGGGADGVNDPVAPTTTWRDRGARRGADGAPSGGRKGNSKPENALFGVLYVGDDTGAQFPLKVPAGAGRGGEFGAHRAWRNTSVAKRRGATIGKTLLGWEWDAVPSGASSSDIHALARSVQPAGVKRLTATDPTALDPSTGVAYLRDDGRTRKKTPPPGISREVNAAIHTAPSGAMVFASGTMQWSWGLGPHYRGVKGSSYTSPRRDHSNPVIQQATHNILSDMGVEPDTPSEGIVRSKT